MPRHCERQHVILSIQRHPERSEGSPHIAQRSLRRFAANDDKAPRNDNI